MRRKLFHNMYKYLKFPLNYNKNTNYAYNIYKNTLKIPNDESLLVILRRVLYRHNIAVRYIIYKNKGT